MTQRWGMETHLSLIYKIVDEGAWHKAQLEGVFTGASIDLQDGYIHLSTATQMHQTAALYFAGQNNLMLIAVDDQNVAHKLKWEASRGGQLFPHIYGTIEMSDVIWAKALPWNGIKHEFPPEAL